MSNKITNSAKVVEIMDKFGGIDAKAAFLYLHMNGGTFRKVISELRKNYDRTVYKYTYNDTVSGVRSRIYYFDKKTK